MNKNMVHKDYALKEDGSIKSVKCVDLFAFPRMPIALSIIHPTKSDRAPHTLAKNGHYHKKLT